MHVDPRSLVGGFLLGGALWVVVIGVTLIRRGRFFTPQAWANPHLSPRSQGRGFLLIGATFTLCGLAYLFSIPLGAVLLVAGLVATNLYGRRLQRRAGPQPDTEPAAPHPPRDAPRHPTDNDPADSDPDRGQT